MKTLFEEKEDVRNLFNKIRKLDASKYEEAINIAEPGYFGGNEVLFIGQNPGYPKPDKVDFDKILVDKNTTDMDFHEAYKNAQLSWKFYDFIKDIIGDSMNFSILNPVFFPTNGNQTPSVELTNLCEDYFIKAINLINPKTIICLSYIAKLQLLAHGLDRKYKIIYTKHYAYWLRRPRVEYIKEVNNIKAEIVFKK